MKSELGVQQFTDYRVFLQAHAEEMKRKKHQWSYGQWSKSLGLKATSSLTKIIQGQREPGTEITEKFVNYFKFSDKQAGYFRDLVRLHKIKNDPRLSVLLMEKMGKEFPSAKARIMDDKTFLVISNWYYLAVRELARSKKFDEDPEWISHQFQFKVTAREIKQAIQVLLNLQLLERKNGRLQILESRIDTANDIASEAIKRYHEQMLEHAKAAVRQFSTEERELSSTTLIMSSKKMAEAKQLIRDFKLKFEQLMEDESGDQIYQVQLQLFPLTKKL